MSIIPLDLERTFERRCAARFALAAGPHAIALISIVDRSPHSPNRKGKPAGLKGRACGL
jgi:hypothetical protein